MHDLTTAQVIARFNDAFLQRDASLLADILDDDVVMEGVQPAPNGSRTQGYDNALAWWTAQIQDPGSHFETEDVQVAGDRAVIRWRYIWGPGPDDSVRGVNLMQVRDGRITEALGYSKLFALSSP